MASTSIKRVPATSSVISVEVVGASTVVVTLPVVLILWIIMYANTGGRDDTGGCYRNKISSQN